VLTALNPFYGVHFLAGHGVIGLFTLGAVFLAVTGAEALYADLGHFGRGPIRSAWLTVVLPALLINYFGQGALVLVDPKAIGNPFFLLYPDWALLPMVFLATAATVIASQAVITGAYSISQQAIHLGLLPRLEIRHTSEALAGQIYMPAVNGLLLVGVLFLVLMFRSSSALASAYGIAVTGTMVVTAVLAFIVIWKVWRWPVFAAAALIAPFLLIFDIPRRKLAQGRGRRLGAAGAWCSDRRRDADMAPRQPSVVRKDPQIGGPVGAIGFQPGEKAAGQGVGHSGVSDQ
jgi:KUP system potassium uptake protein